MVDIPGDINTSDGLTKSLPSVNLRNLSSVDLFRIVAGKRKCNKRKIPSAKPYIYSLYWNYPGGGEDLYTDMRRETLGVRCWQMVLDRGSPLNSFFATRGVNSPIAFNAEATDFHFKNEILGVFT